jgi:hypothetical protein
MIMCTSVNAAEPDSDFAAAEKALHEPFVSDIVLVATANTSRTCKCTTCDSWMPCRRHVPDFCTCPNCGAVH